MKMNKILILSTCTFCITSVRDQNRDFLNNLSYYIEDTEGKDLEFSLDQHFNFNVHAFTIENITKALYSFQLKKLDGITINLDYRTTGVGDTSQPVLNSYRGYPQTYLRKFTIRPIGY